jgi:uncharacterized protein involved in response to NO
VHPQLKAMLMPWTRASRLDKVLGSMALLALAMTISLYFTPLLAMPAVVLLLVGSMLLLVQSVRLVRERRRNANRLVTLYLAQLVEHARVPVHVLPADVQEEISMLRAEFHLKDPDQ